MRRGRTGGEANAKAIQLELNAQQQERKWE